MRPRSSSARRSGTWATPVQVLSDHRPYPATAVSWRGHCIRRGHEVSPGATAAEARLSRHDLFGQCGDLPDLPGEPVSHGRLTSALVCVSVVVSVRVPPGVPPRPWNGESPGPEAIPSCYELEWPSLYDPVVESGTLQLRQDLLTLTAAIESYAVAIDRWRTIDHETSRARDLRKPVARRPGAGVYAGHLDEQPGSTQRPCDLTPAIRGY